MDHPCHKCGHSIEDGKPFCAECGAPQIRVPITEVPAEPIGASGGISPALVHEPEASFPHTPISPLPVRWFSLMRPSALAAGVTALLMVLGLNLFAGALVAGFLAATFSHRSISRDAIRTAAAARLGAFSALLLFGISTIVETLAVVVLHKGADIRSQIMEKIQQTVALYPRTEVQPFLDFVNSPDGFAFIIAGSVVLGLVAFAILGGLGGAVSAAFSGRRNRR